MKIYITHSEVQKKQVVDNRMVREALRETNRTEFSGTIFIKRIEIIPQKYFQYKKY